jgi:hypothetical protein
LQCCSIGWGRRGEGAFLLSVCGERASKKELQLGMILAGFLMKSKLDKKRTFHFLPEPLKARLWKCLTKGM